MKLVTPSWSLRYRVQLYVTFIVFGVVLTGTLLGYRYAADMLSESWRERLHLTTDLKQSELLEYIQQRQIFVEALGNQGEVKDAIRSYSAAFQLGTDSAEFAEADIKYARLFAGIAQSYDFYDVFLISMEGDIVFTQARERDFGTNISRLDQTAGRGLPYAVTQALETLSPSFSDYV